MVDMPPLPPTDLAPAAPPVNGKGFLKLSPIAQRRWNVFRGNRRGYWSLWIFALLFLASLGAELIANDRPIIASYKGEILVPILFDYPEEKFGGFLPETDYRDKVISSEISAHGWAIWPPVRFSYRTVNYNTPKPFPTPPTWSLTDKDCAAAAQRAGGATCRDIEWNWLGTDDQGRDLIARLIYGFRLSVLFGLILTVISSVIGFAAGAVQGYFGGWTDLLFQRLIEIWSAIPSLYFLLVVSSFLSPSFGILLGILLLFSWISLVGVVRAEFLRCRNFEYVRAAKALGLGDAAIMIRHIMPNAMVATLTILPFNLIGGISSLTALDFLGLGLPPGSPSLGELLLQGKSNLQAPWLGLSSFLTIAVMLSLLIFIGEAMRDAFDPRKTFK